MANEIQFGAMTLKASVSSSEPISVHDNGSIASMRLLFDDTRCAWLSYNEVTGKMEMPDCYIVHGDNSLWLSHSPITRYFMTQDYWLQEPL